MKKSILAMGWFGHGNVGDEAFKSCYVDLWGQSVDFTFCPFGHVPKDLNDYDACFIGGGSFLDQALPVLPKIQIPLAFIGVGIHDSIHEANWPALKRAKIIVARNDGFHFPLETVYGSDLVFARDVSKFVTKTPPNPKTMLILGNDFLLARRDQPHWKNVWYHTFANEFAGLLDDYVDDGWFIRFAPMQTPADPNEMGAHDDRLFAAHIVSQMRTRRKVKLDWEGAEEKSLLQKIEAASLVVSMRFHGNIFSTILGKPFIGILSHDKMKSYFTSLGVGNFLDYYGFTKNQFIDRQTNRLPGQEYLLEVAERERVKWRSISAIVAGRLNL